MAHSPTAVLVTYKEQQGIERNFGFLKRPDRIEVLGFILLTSPLVWNLMEHVMRFGGCSNRRGAIHSLNT